MRGAGDEGGGHGEGACRDENDADALRVRDEPPGALRFGERLQGQRPAILAVKIGPDLVELPQSVGVSLDCRQEKH